MWKSVNNRKPYLVEENYVVSLFHVPSPIMIDAVLDRLVQNTYKIACMAISTKIKTTSFFPVDIWRVVLSTCTGGVEPNQAFIHPTIPRRKKRARPRGGEGPGAPAVTTDRSAS